MPPHIFRRRPGQSHRGWPLIVAVIVAVNLLIAARSVISRMPHGDPDIKVIKGDAASIKHHSNHKNHDDNDSSGTTTINAASKSSLSSSSSSPPAVVKVRQQPNPPPIDPETARLAALRTNTSLPLVFFDAEIKGKPVGRIEMVLYPDAAPRSAENFRQLCTGEAGKVPNEDGREGAGLPLHFKGASFYRIIDQFIDQAGIHTESVFGGMFQDDAGGLALKHQYKGLLSMANMGPNTNTAHFSIMMGPQPHLDGSYTIFGQVVTGFEAVDEINALSIGLPDNTATADAGAKIANCGQIRTGTIVPDLKAGLNNDAGSKGKKKDKDKEDEASSR